MTRNRRQGVAATALLFGIGLVVAVGVGGSCGRTELDLAGGTASVGNGTTGSGGAEPSSGGTAGTSTGNGAAGAAGPATGAGGVRGSGGAGGAGGVPGANGTGGRRGNTPPPTPIPCGNDTCTSGTEVCCVRGGRGGGPTCIRAGANCPTGVSFACTDLTNCATGQICCSSLLIDGTTCADAETCLRRPGSILCRTRTDCPTFAPNCCDNDGTSICAAQTCPAGGGGGPGPGGGGPGPGGGGPGPGGGGPGPGGGGPGG